MAVDLGRFRGEGGGEKQIDKTALALLLLQSVPADKDSVAVCRLRDTAADKLLEVLK